jgi:hypothetical protein
VGLVESAARIIKAERRTRLIGVDDSGKGSELRAKGCRAATEPTALSAKP